MGLGLPLWTGRQGLALLRNGIREIVTLRPQDPGFLTAKYKLNFRETIGNLSVVEIDNEVWTSCCDVMTGIGIGR